MSIPTGPRTPNRLADETSPYLLQHATNPVDWYPWGDEAIGRARAEDKPIFLSIGYSACHWCHVMERESFENLDIADYLNQRFISIKVDREERPDVDDLYMQAVQMMTGRGGWPMSVFLTPELAPFFGGTYYPPVDGPHGPGFLSILKRIADLFAGEKDKLEANAAQMVRLLTEQSGPAPAAGVEGELDFSILERATQDLARRFDASYGGFGPAPKFPPSMALDLLLREHGRTGEGRLLDITEKTLRAMAGGGLQDHLGGGFHRYSTDHLWLVPHFEKMLYDNALLAPVYFDAYRATGDRHYEAIGRRTLDYVIRDLQLPEGGYASAEDADSEGVEGKFYVWRPADVIELLGDEDADLFGKYYDVTEGGNFEGDSILHVITPLDEFARRHEMEPARVERRLRAAEEKLLAARGRRVRPGRDDKVLTAWNGMTIAAMARGAQATGEARYRESAERAAQFVLEHLRTERGALLRAWRGGRAHVPAFVEDYAHLIGGLIDLYGATFDPEWLRAAAELADAMISRFADPAGGGFFTADGADPTLIVRRKDTYDGATPSGNSAATMALLRLAALLDRADYREAAMNAIGSMRGHLRDAPGAVHHLLCAASVALAPPREVAIIGDPAALETRALVAEVWKRYLPGAALAVAAPDALDHGFNVEIAALRGKRAIEGNPTAYVCENRACKEPVQSPQALANQLAAW